MAAQTNYGDSEDSGAARLQTALAKIRHHTNSKLENQKAPAQLLVAVEAALDEQAQEGETAAQSKEGTAGSRHAVKKRKPAEYFLALDSMLEKASSKEAPASLLPSSLYLLSIVTPHVAAGVLRARLHSLLSPLATLLSNPHPSTSGADIAENHAAALRSALGVLQPLLLALSPDRATLERDLPLRGCWNAALQLCTDARPKVRRRAQELVGAILLADTPRLGDGKKSHPYAARTADWAVRALEAVADAGGVGGPSSAKKQERAPKYDKKSGKAHQPEAAAALRQKQAAEGGASVGIWLCGFIRTLVPILPSAAINPLCTILLRLPGLQNPFLTVAAFEVFESLFKSARPEPAPTGGLTLAAPTTTTSAEPIGADTLTRTLSALRSPAVVPAHTDVQSLPSYLRALEHALVSYTRLENGASAWALTPQAWADIFELSLSARSDASRSTPAVRLAGRDALASLARYCIPDAALDEALAAHAQGGAEKAATTGVGSMITLVADAVGKHALRYTHSRAEVLAVLAALIARMRYRPSVSTNKAGKSPAKSANATRASPAATTLLLPLVRVVADLRANPRFEQREQADTVLGTAIEVIGPEALLEVLPLGLLGENGDEGGRAWLLPLMRARITNTTLAHFTTVMVPLSEALFNRRAEAEEGTEEGKGRPIEAKVFEALTEQVWACFPGYCDLPVDVEKAFTKNFAELLANVLYTQPPLRPSVFRGLQTLVERNEALAASSAPAETLQRSFGVDQEQGRRNLSFLTDMASNLLAVFFNVFSQAPGESRGYVSECIGTYLRIMTPADIETTYAKVKDMLEQSLPQLPNARNRETGAGAIPPVAHTMLDLLIALVPFLNPAPGGTASQLFELTCEDKLLKCSDAGVQKKTYRILSRLVDGRRGEQVLRVPSASGAGAGRVGELLAKLADATGDVAPGAKRDRIGLLAALVPRIPADQLHYLPSIIPEAVLATKEANQGAREAAYELLVLMGHKMEGGGTIKRSLVEGAAEVPDTDAEMKDETEAIATVQEYITMVSAGLAGASPHMISASITALSRLIFEFKDSVPRETLDEMLATLVIFVASTNREIVKSALGFVKVAVVALPSSLVDTHLPTLVPALLGWSAEHKQHFKAKVRHLFERLIRRFGFERVASLTDEDNRKLINNIRKRKERARRKKAARDEEDESEDEENTKGGTSRGADAFEEVIYGSESDISSDDSDDGGNGAGGITSLAKRAAAARGGKSGAGAGASGGKARGRTGKGEEAYIMEDDDEPMDLLDRSAAAGRITRTNPAAQNNRRRKPGQEAAAFGLDEATGRMVIDDPETGSGPGANAGGAVGATIEDEDAQAGAGQAYLDKERGADGFTTRGKGGAVKFNKNNKRTREQEFEMELEQLQDEGPGGGSGAGAGAGGAAGKKDKKRKKTQASLGSEFKAKRAQGDVSKNGQSPYAYLPLSQVSGKKGKGGPRAEQVNITGKNKGKGRR